MIFLRVVLANLQGHHEWKAARYLEDGRLTIFKRSGIYYARLTYLKRLTDDDHYPEGHVTRMPAINIICGHREVEILTDAAFCDADGAIQRIASRIVPSEMGDGLILAHDLTSIDLSIGQRFKSFDDAVDNMDSLLPRLMESGEIKAPCQLFLAGWSVRREETEAYTISTHRKTLSSWYPESREFSQHSLQPYKLLQLPHIFLSPAPEPEILEAACIGSFHLGWRPDKISHEMKKLITAQRHSRSEGRYLVGGFAERKWVDVNWGGIKEQLSPEIVWDYDKIGSAIIPRSRDWENCNGKR